MKKLTAVILALILILCLCSCNAQLIDTTYSYEKAIISLPNGEVIEGDVNSWKDYEDSDQIQVNINGIQYYTHSSNVVLISSR